MTGTDFIIITQSESVNYDEYSKLPLQRRELYSELVFPRMIYYKNGFHSHLDIINFFRDGVFFSDSDYPQRRNLLNIWNLPGMNSIHLPNYLLRCGIKTKVINNLDAEWDVFRNSYEASEIPPLVGISTTFYLSYSEVCRIVKKIRKHYPDVTIVLGGAFVNAQFINGDVRNFEKLMRKYGINYILHAFNSEIDLRDLIRNIKRGKGVDKIRNLAYIERGDFSKGSFRSTKARWNKPILEETLVPLDKLDTSFINHTVQMRTSYGCPFSCSFCSYPKMAREFHLRTPESVERDIASVLKIPGVNTIIFIDDTFNVPNTRFKEICRLFCKYDFEWFSFLRVQFVDEETVRLMKDSGCKGVYLGIESANDLILENMNKKATRSQFIKGLNLLKKYDIISLGAFIIGFPGETGKSIQENIEFIESNGMDFYTLKEFYYMKHTSIYEERDKFGLSGIGSDWKHDTMDYKTAYRKKIEMFKTIENSVFIDADTNLWYLAYLYDQGYNKEAIVKIQKEINNVMLAQIDGVYDDNHPAFGHLQSFISAEARSR